MRIFQCKRCAMAQKRSKHTAVGVKTEAKGWRELREVADWRRDGGEKT